MNSIVVFYWISVFMLANGSLFTWIFSGTPLVAWRQLIWFLGIIVLFKFARSFDSYNLLRIVRIHFYIFLFILFQALITLAVYNFNYMRLMFAFWVYFSGLPFIIFPFFISQNGKEYVLRFYNVFICLGVFLTFGLILDYLTGGFFTKYFLLSVSSSLADLLKSGRYCFLSEAPTTFGVYYCFCLFCTLYRFYIEEKQKRKLLLFLVAVSYIGGAWLTGSRQIVFALLLVISISLFYYFIAVMDNKKTVLIGFLLLCFIAPYVSEFLISDKSYQDRYSSTSIKEDTRYKAWNKGWNDNVVDNVDRFFVGKAIALSQGQKANRDELQGSHYENTFFARLSETGIVGVFLLLLPLFWLLSNWNKTDYFNFSLLSFFLSYVFISYISPNGAHQTSQMTVYLALGVFLNKNQFDLIG